jgi:hypothetical protein
MTTTIKGIAPMRTELEFITDCNNPEELLINIAEEISGGLDSHDLGDAMGAFISHAQFNDSEFEIINEIYTLRVAIVFENFEWEK